MRAALQPAIPLPSSRPGSGLPGTDDQDEWDFLVSLDAFYRTRLGGARLGFGSCASLLCMRPPPSASLTRFPTRRQDTDKPRQAAQSGTALPRGVRAPGLRSVCAAQDLAFCRALVQRAGHRHGGVAQLPRVLREVSAGLRERVRAPAAAAATAWHAPLTPFGAATTAGSCSRASVAARAATAAAIMKRRRARARGRPRTRRRPPRRRLLPQRPPLRRGGRRRARSWRC